MQTGASSSGSEDADYRAWQAPWCHWHGRNSVFLFAGMFSNNSRSVSLETEIMVEEMREHCQELRTQLEAKVRGQHH